jgi:hypothetical protein
MAKLDKVIRVRVSEDEKELLEKTAVLAGVSESEVIRKLISFAAKLVAADQGAKLVGRNKGLDEYFEIFEGVKPYDVSRILVMLGMIAADNGKLAEYESILEPIYGKKSDSITSAIVDVAQKYAKEEPAGEVEPQK